MTDKASLREPEETYSTEGPKCPYCGYQMRAADDPLFYDEMRFTECECDDCGKTFRVSVYTETSWTCEPLAALIAEGA